MKNEIYRFRSINSLIGEYNELESQTIFFASPETLNDPMEGFRDIFWQGDFVVWRNLFRHYLLCLERMCSMLLIAKKDYPILPEHIPVYSGIDDFPTPKYKELFSNISTDFFKSKKLLSLVEALSERTTPIRKDELSYYLNIIHAYALETIFLAYEKNKLMPTREYHISNSENLIDSTSIELIQTGLDRGDFNEDRIKALFTSFSLTNQQMNLIHHYNNNINNEDKNKNFVFADFVNEYIIQIEKLVYPTWYTACFMSECTNSSVWGNYGDNHTGACLIFNTELTEKSTTLSLKGITGYSFGQNDPEPKPSYGFRKYPFYQINYIDGFGEIDFFRMMGRLPIPTLNSTWYTFDKNTSICSGRMTDSIDEWRNNYWGVFYRDITVKTKDWEYENEFRLILSGSLIDLSDPKNRVLNYDFKSLKGIIFGIKTKKEDKIKIMRIIGAKCAENDRHDFKFHQAFYSPIKKCIDYSEMSLISFTQKVNEAN
ncbi:DUF2971 domain-containing protein [Serratia bockelmannii]|uniref:DUF2971 domain-containing protein n=1 Tax=Serratia bockelmannii TaxID=2703793 RepID=UPI00384D7504